MNLILAVLFNVLIFVILREIGKRNYPVLPIITLNYLVAATTGLLTFSITDLGFSLFQWFLLAGMGLLFLVLFIKIAALVEVTGVAFSGMVVKLSILIPVLFGLTFLQEPLTLPLVIGVLFSILAIFFTGDFKQSNAWRLMLIVFIGAGINDTMLNLIQHQYFQPSQLGLVTTFIFAFAGCFGIVKWGTSKLAFQKMHKSHIIYGILLGVPNFGSIYYILQTLSSSTLESSQILPILNVSILLGTSFTGWTFFKESFSLIKGIGFFLGCIALWILNL